VLWSFLYGLVTEILGPHCKAIEVVERGRAQVLAPSTP